MYQDQQNFRNANELQLLRRPYDEQLFNPFNPELNPIRYLLALLAHHFLHVSRIRVKEVTKRYRCDNNL